MAVFGSYIVWYLFAAGLGSGCFVVAACSAIYDTKSGSRRSESTLKHTQLGFYLAPVCLILATLFLFIDLGVPDRIWLIILTPLESVVSLGAWMVALLILVSGALALCALTLEKIPRFFLWFCWLAGIPLAFGVMLYTGFLLSDMVSIDFWCSRLLPVLFVFSSLSTGLAAIMGLDTFIGEKKVSERGTGLDNWSILVGILELIVLVCFLFDRYGFSETARQSCEMLFFGEHAVLFWLGLCGCGFVLPFIAHALNKVLKMPALGFVAAVSVLIGGLCLRYCIIGAALYSAPVLGVFL